MDDDYDWENDFSGTSPPDGRWVSCTCGWHIDVLVPRYGDPTEYAATVWGDHAEVAHPVPVPERFDTCPMVSVRDDG